MKDITGLGSVFDFGGKLIDKLFPDKDAANAAKLRMVELAQSGELQELSQRADVIKTEASSTHWLAANWRPITMLTFTALIVARWLGWAAPNLSEAEYLKLWDIVELGLGGYTIMRSVEKITPHISDAIKKRG